MGAIDCKFKTHTKYIFIQANAINLIYIYMYISNNQCKVTWREINLLYQCIDQVIITIFFILKGKKSDTS
jgi:hypothetical protein